MNFGRKWRVQLNRRVALSVLVLAAMGLIGCKGGLGIGANGFAGTFVNHAMGEFSVADDTLVVEQVKGGRYTIVRHMGYMMQGKREETAHQVHAAELWKAVLDKDRGTLTEGSRGRVLSLDGDTLLLEHSAYVRVK